MTADMELQRKEFEALSKLTTISNQGIAVVDDDYPEWRHRYEGALLDFLKACVANGRFDTGQRGALLNEVVARIPKRN